MKCYEQNIIQGIETISVKPSLLYSYVVKLYQLNPESLYRLLG